MPRKKKNILEVATAEVVRVEEDTVFMNESGRTTQSIWRRLSRWSLVLGLALMPFFFVPGAPVVASVTQQTVTGSLIIFSFVCFLFDSLREKNIPFSFLSSAVGALLLVFSLAVGASFFFSSAWGLSFWGSGSFEGVTVFAFLLGILVFLLGASLFREDKDFSFLFCAALASIFCAFFLTIFTNVFVLYLQRPFLGISNGGFNLLGGINSLSIFLGAAFISSMGFLLLFESVVMKKVIVGLGAILAFFGFLFFGNTVLFGISILALLVLLGLSQHMNRGRLGGETIFSILAVAALAFSVFSGYRVGSFLNLPLEVAPSFGSSLSVITQALGRGARYATIGSGPNTYATDFNLFKPLVVNLTALWNVDFPSAYSFWLTLLPTIGVIATLALFLFFVSIIWQSLRRLMGGERGPSSKRECLTALGVVFLFGSSLFFGMTLPLILCLFLGTGLLFGSLKSKIKEEDSLSPTIPSRVFLNTLVLMGLIVASFVFLFFVFQRAYASFVVSRSVAVLNADGNLDAAIRNISDAQRIFPEENTAQLLGVLWQRSLSLSLAGQEVSSTSQISPQVAFNFSVSSTREAIRLNPANHQNWASLGSIYQSVLPLEGALDQSVVAYEQAQRLNPTNPLYPLTLAQLRIFSAESATGTSQANLYQLAEKDLQTSIRLKQNMAESYALLGQLSQMQGKTDEAEVAFQQALSINPEFSDARYLLGLLYKRQERIEEARDSFNEVLRLNPGNSVVLEQLNSLKSSKK